MAARHRVLSLLEQHRGVYVSGEKLARQLHITRAAVWRAIRELRNAGYDIEASTKIGYRLAITNDKLSAEGIYSLLQSRNPVEIMYVEQIDSTNREAKQLALSGAPHGTVVVAGEQTSGRGRQGRVFFSPHGTGIYMSLILRLDVPSTLALRITALAAVAVCRAIEQYSSRIAAIKWVNDVYLDGLKVCGILTEGISGFESGRIESIVVGIGVNFAPPAEGFPQEISGIATSLFPQITPTGITRNHVCAAIIDQFFALLPHLQSPEIIDEYRNRSIVIGRRVKVIRLENEYEADVEDITDNGSLSVRLDDGSTEFLSSGEISLRPIIISSGVDMLGTERV